MKFNIAFFISVFALIGCNLSKEKPLRQIVDPIQISMDKHANALLLDSKISATSIGIYKDGKKYTAHYGELDRGKGNSPTNSTVYEIASVSKTFAGILVANAVIEGNLKLEDDIREYLKGDYPNFEYNQQPIRVKHLLTHTSRMPRFLPQSIDELFLDFNESLPFKVYEIQKEYSKDDFFLDLNHVVVDTIPGSKYSYSNVDTELMAKILENIYNQPFNDILTHYFKVNANMHDTYIDLPKSKAKELANGYGMTHKLVPHEVVLFGADGGVKTTMPDLVNYMEFQLDDTNKTVTESHRVLYDNGSTKMAYYLPLRTNKEYGNYYSIHGGGFGSQNWFFILPEYDMGISVITNQSDLETADKLMKTVKGLIQDLK